MRFINDSQRRAVFASLGAESHGGIMSNLFSRRSDRFITKEEKKVLDKYGIPFDVDGVDEILLADLPKRDKLRRLENFAKVMVSTEKRFDTSREFQDDARRAHFNDLAEMYASGVLEDDSSLLKGAKRSSYFRDRVKDLTSLLSNYGFNEKMELAKRAARGDIHLDEVDAYRVMSSGDSQFRKMFGLFNAGESDDEVKRHMAISIDEISGVPSASYELRSEQIPAVIEEAHYDVPVTYDMTVGYYGGEQ